MIWSSRARNKSCSPPSRCSRGRIRSSAPASAEHRIRAFDSRESQFPFCQELTPTAAIPGKFQRRNSPTSTRQTAPSRVFHSRLEKREQRLAAQTRRLGAVLTSFPGQRLRPVCLAGGNVAASHSGGNDGAE